MSEIKDFFENLETEIIRIREQIRSKASIIHLLGKAANLDSNSNEKNRYEFQFNGSETSEFMAEVEKLSNNSKLITHFKNKLTIELRTKQGKALMFVLVNNDISTVDLVGFKSESSCDVIFE